MTKQTDQLFTDRDSWFSYHHSHSPSVGGKILIQGEFGPLVLVLLLFTQKCVEMAIPLVI